MSFWVCQQTKCVPVIIIFKDIYMYNIQFLSVPSSAFQFYGTIFAYMLITKDARPDPAARPAR